MATVSPFRNEHVSVSRLELLAQCGLAFKLRYVEHASKEPASEPPEFGTLVHSALENVHLIAIQEGHIGRVSDAMVLDAWRAEFQAAPAVVTSPEFYAEGLDLVRAYFRRNPEIDSRRVIGLEQEFRVAVGRFVLLGYMDRVEQLDEETVLIDDYKTSRKMLDAETDVQASTYHLAARELYPWARHVVFRFQMLRHGVAVEAPREEDQLELARNYLVALAERSESGRDDAFQPQLGPNCPWCDYRRQCPAYAQALRSRAEFAAVDRGDLDAVAREYQSMHALSKAAYARKKELEDLLRARAEQRGPFDAAGYHYELVPFVERELRPERVLKVLGQATELSDSEIAAEVMRVEKKSLEAFLRELDGPPPEGEQRYRSSPRTRLIRAQIEAGAEERPRSARLDARPIRAELRRR